MLVEPIPIRPFRLGSRLATILLVIGPIVAIALPATQAPLEAARQPSDSSEAHVAARSAPPQEQSRTDAASKDGFPATAFGLPVRTVAATLEAGVLADADGGLVAVSGFLSSDLAGLDCIVPKPAVDEAPLPCQRSITVVDHPTAGPPAPTDPSLSPTAVSDLTEPHLEASIPPDSALATALGPDAGTASSAPRSIPVVLIGRLGRPSGSCVAAAGWCRSELAILRVAWAGGQWRDWVFLNGGGPFENDGRPA